MVFLDSRLFFSWHQVDIPSFSWFQVGLSWFQVGFHGFSWFQVGFSFFHVEDTLKLYSCPTIQSRPGKQMFVIHIYLKAGTK